MTISDTVMTRPLVSYGSYIGGREVAGSNWVYVADPRVMLDDAFTTLTLKRNLDSGNQPYTDGLPGIVGRVRLAPATTWRRRFRLRRRLRRSGRPRRLRYAWIDFLDQLRARILDRRAEIERMALYEGHPREPLRCRLNW
jgi:hypothetical protein